jgi:hypothetical protein
MVLSKIIKGMERYSGNYAGLASAFIHIAGYANNPILTFREQWKLSIFSGYN